MVSHVVRALVLNRIRRDSTVVWGWDTNVCETENGFFCVPLLDEEWPQEKTLLPRA